ncbi:hypothetical protein NDU88_007557 [Pleurodeles waltl]|uniref:Uncharacterized protein n=1 Tax=Pleurodeles waltl TaxID=8319 RepID=A0AAV7NTY2_PLEWA|nr:hypothetical protein NDU88_007557 [Pleurodeles waltl]
MRRADGTAYKSAPVASSCGGCGRPLGPTAIALKKSAEPGKPRRFSATSRAVIKEPGRSLRHCMPRKKIDMCTLLA